MGLSLYLFILLFSFHLIVTVSSSFEQPLCHDDESLALLQFKQSFFIYENASFNNSFAYPKTASWKLNESSSSSSSDCCSWDGVECNGKTGHVIGLDLSSSFLYGSINSTSTLFRLLHLQELNLANNNFNYSQIPSTIGHLSRLTYLNLSSSVFSGQIPSKISELSQLASLGLCCNIDSSSQSLLKLENLNLFLQNLTNLKVLTLSYVNISSTVPHILANFSSLTILSLRGCGLHGEFPTQIFQLPNLQFLSVRFNPYLTGFLPKFNKSNSLELLKVAGTSFSGELPNSIGDINSLKELDISDCNFSGSVPYSLGNLTQLTTLDLSFNDFDRGTLAWLVKQTKLISLQLAGTNLIGDIPPSLGNLTQLTFLSLHTNQLSGQIPYSLGNLTQLAILDLQSNQLTGEIPSWLANLTHLTRLVLDRNKLHGPIPQSIHRLVNLNSLFLKINNLSGTVELDMFINLENLIYLELSYNNLSLLTNTNTNATRRKFKLLGLGSCNLSQFPDVLRYQNELEILNLCDNRIHGQIPKWVWDIGKETLMYMSLSQNFLTGFDQPLIVLPWTSLRYLHLGSNKLRGSLPIPSLTTSYYSVSNNLLTGEISPLICNLSSLYYLDLSNNRLSGMLPLCLGNFMDSLLVLNLRNNTFHGTIPQTCMSGSELRMLDLSRNRLQGQLPRSLANCKKLEILDLRNNRINDTFPPCLGTFPELKILILRSNEFYGAIRSSETMFEFPKLRIIDLSDNSFTGKFPYEYINNWNAMKVVGEENLTYLQANTNIDMSNYASTQYSYVFSMEITNKGIETIYAKIPDILVAIDLSSNKFEGDIPKSIGNLKGIQLLNLSSNIFTGPIPIWLANLTELESLDLSQNMLSGEIPQQLTGLTFLAFFNVSHNHLMGPIPQGKQFDTFENNSFGGNSGLCGKPLSKKCGNSGEVSPSPPLTAENGKDAEFPSGYDWIFIGAGFGSGLVVGLVIGHTFTTRKHKWLVETFGRKLHQKQREKKKGRKNRT